MTADSVYYLTVSDLHVIAADAVGNYLVRDPGLLASAGARPQTTVFGTDAYPTLLHKAAALLQSIAGNHPLMDGNKRLAIAAAVVFLARNGFPVEWLDEDLAYELIMAVACGELDEVTDIAERLASVFDVEIVEVDGALRVARAEGAATRGQHLVRRLRGTANSRDIESTSTDQIMDSLRGE